MKSIIAVCSLRDMVIEKFGVSAWEAVLGKSGLSRNTVFLPTEDFPDELVMVVAKNLCDVMKISMEQAADAFGEYWINSYAPKVHGSLHIVAPSSRDFILKLGDIHDKACRALKGAKTPIFKFDWKDEDTLIITFESKSQVPFFIGLIKGVGRYFDEGLSVSECSFNQVSIVFPQGAIWQK
jgi:hypothetical protein